MEEHSRNRSDSLVDEISTLFFPENGLNNPMIHSAFIDSTLFKSNKKYRFKKRIWGFFISPLILLSSIFLYVLAPLKFFKEGMITLISSNFNQSLKRFLDILGAVLCILFFLPVFLIVPILIKLDSKGPVFYTQLRVGQNRRKKSRRSIAATTTMDRRNGDRRGSNYYGKLFYIYKFRTMREDAEKKCGPVWATDNDPRITSVGSFLRKTHLDELPQLINIFRGEMSFVGPRPERPNFVSEFAEKIPNYSERLSIKPGLTGLAQVKSGYDNSFQSVKKKLLYDLYYCENGTIISYLKIIFLTIYEVSPRRVKEFLAKYSPKLQQQINK